MSPLKTKLEFITATSRANLRHFSDTRQLIVWLIAPVIGALVGLAAILFREGIAAVQLLWLGTRSEKIVAAASNLPWYWIVGTPTLGGLLIGLLLHYVMPGQRTYSVADVIEARAKGGEGLPFRAGVSSALITMLSLGTGTSAGREGPMVHLGATIGASLCRAFSLPEAARRLFLACGVASAVSASFNVPIAGMLFAHEVILGHYALSAIGPIAAASVTGTIVARLWFGNAEAFIIPFHQITSYLEFPVFVLLGLLSGLIAVLFQFLLTGTDWAARNIPIPTWTRPLLGGLVIGCIALVFPEILGVGYGTTDDVLKNNLPLSLMLWLLLAKAATTAIALASRLGGGIFSPSLYLGALTGGSLGLAVAMLFPHTASSEGLYAILGMGAVTAAVLGAPISTTMIVFELTGGYAVSIALLLCVSISTGLTQAIHGRSFFMWQLEMRGVRLTTGSHDYLRDRSRVRSFMDAAPKDEEGNLQALPPESTTLLASDTLTKALRIFDETGASQLPVVDSVNRERIIGIARHVRALNHFNKVLIRESEESHR